MAIANKKPRMTELCPLCHQEGKERPLKYEPGGKFAHFCDDGHEFPDMEKLATLLAAMHMKKAPVVAEPLAEVDLPPQVGIVIGDMDQARIQSILGPFTDSSSLFGALFAFNEELKHQREQVAKLNALRSQQLTGATAPATGGDMSIEVFIPEEHIQPTMDVAEACGMDVTNYMRQRIKEGFTNGWYS